MIDLKYFDYEGEVNLTPLTDYLNREGVYFTTWTLTQTWDGLVEKHDFGKLLVCDYFRLYRVLSDGKVKLVLEKISEPSNKRFFIEVEKRIEDMMG